MKRAFCIFWLLLINFFSAASIYDVFEENGKVGLKSDQGKVLIPAKYDALGWSDGRFTITNNVVGYRIDGYWGLISLENKIITKPVYEELNPADGNLILAKKKSSLSMRLAAGCISTSGKELIPFQYDGISIHNLRAIVFTRIGNQYKYGLVDLDNKTLIPQQYKKVSGISPTRYAVESFEQKTALFTDAGKQVTLFNIDSISTFRRNYAVIFQGEKQGLIDKDGVVKVEAKNREMMIEENGSVFRRDLDEWLFLDGQNKLSQKKSADSVRAIGKNLLQISTAGLTHLEDYKFTSLYSNSFHSLGKFIKRKAIFSTGGKYGVTRIDGKAVIFPKYDLIKRDQDYFIANQRQAGKDNWVVIDSLGNALNAKTYEHIYPFTGKVFPVSNRNFWGVMGANGKELIACAYDSIIQIYNDLAVVKFKGQYGIVTLNEQWKVTPRSEKLFIVNDNRYLERTSKTTYLKSLDGSTIYFSDNKLVANPNRIIETLSTGNIWEIDLDGVIVNRKLQPDTKVEVVTSESEGLRGIRKNGQYGFIDSQGRLRIANRYENIRPFQEQLAPIKIRGKWGFVTHDDKLAVQPVYDDVLPFTYGLSIVLQKGMYGLIDKTGKVILPCRYELINVPPTGNVVFRQAGLYGLSARDGRILINPKYNQVTDVGNNYVIVERDGKFGIITIEGISTVPLVYDGLTYDKYNGTFIALKKAAWVQVNL